MIRALITVRLRAMLAAMTRQDRKGTGSGKGSLILYGILYLYLGVVLCGMMAMTFFTLAQPYHEANLDWLYFSGAGLMALGLSLFGTVFSTQSQLYDAKDNHLLLSMPIPPRAILLSRMVPLLGLNLVFVCIVMVPAMVVYGIFVRFTLMGLVGQLLAIIGITVLAQAIACLLGWLLHLLLKRINKSLASVLYMVIFLVVYFSIFGQSNTILNTLVAQSGAFAETVKNSVWPLYALGNGCTGNAVPMLLFFAISAACFGAVYYILSRSFLKTAASSFASSRRKKLELNQARTRTPKNAIAAKELQKFLGTPIYLTNMGIGLLMCVALTVAALFFQKDVPVFLDALELPEGIGAVMVFSALCFLNSTMCISAPGVSLEGKNLWILKSMPLDAKDILRAKLLLHIRLTVPVISASGLILCLVVGCGIVDALLCALLCGLTSVFCGLLGLVTGLKWARFDYISDAYPCKQAVYLPITMFSVMGLPLLLGLIFGYFITLSPTLFLALSIAVLSGACLGFYRLMCGWGVRKWDSL